MSLLKVSALSYALKSHTLLHQISFTLHEGENLIILGENGAGKSTLAKLLCGIIPSEKKVSLNSIFIEDIQAKKRAKEISYMPSKFSLFDPYITVNGYLTLSYYNSRPKPQKIDTILKDLQLFKYKYHYANNLSSGEQQLLLLASTALQEAQISILDEPTSNLDPQKSKSLFDILKKGAQFKQKIIITHNLHFAYKLGYPVLYLDKGSVRYFENDFFTQKHLSHYYHDTVMIEHDTIVEKL